MGVACVVNGFVTDPVVFSISPPVVITAAFLGAVLLFSLVFVPMAGFRYACWAETLVCVGVT